MDSEDEERVKTARVVLSVFGGTPGEDMYEDEKLLYRKAISILMRHLSNNPLAPDPK